MDKQQLIDTAVQHTDELYDKKVKPVPIPEKEIGIDLEDKIIDNIVDTVETSQFDINKLNSFTNVSRSRNDLYNTLDDMSTDSTIAAVLETYAEDATETNDKGNIVWAESDDSECLKFVTYLLNALNIDKNIYQWTHSLCKYGDVYLRLYRESEYDDLLFSDGANKKRKNKKARTDTLNEDVSIKYYSKNDNYVHYLEMAPNPAQVFELTRFGKTAAYIKTNVESDVSSTNNTNQLGLYNLYRFQKNDVELYTATEFVHGCLQDNTSRTPEEVELFVSEDKSIKYKVKRGQSLLYNSYKTWRQLMLLENSVLLNRITQSSIVRVIGVEVGDMPKENVPAHLMNIKQLIEQKAAIEVGKSINEYTNPGPVINNVYIPTRNQQGAITTQQIGGDVKIGDLADLDYYQDKYFGSLRIPKQYFGCLRGNTPILLLNGEIITIEEMFKNKERYVGKGIMACDTDGSLVPTVIAEILLTKPKATFLRIHLDNGKYVDVTPDHRMMLRDGSFITADKLAEGDSLMPYYDRINAEGRREVLDNKTGKFRPQFRIVAESVCDIPKRYQVHHLDCNKKNDDFENLVPLTVKDHYALHFDLLHDSARESNQNRKSEGIPHGNKGHIMITNGIENHWIDENDKIPENYYRGMTRNTTNEERETKAEQMSERFSGKDPWNKGLTAETSDSVLRGKINSTKTKKEREEQGLYKESHRICGQKVSQYAAKTVEQRSELHRNRFPENRQNRPHYVRCACCGTIKQIFCNGDYYKDYLNKDKLWYCSADCKKIDGAGKLSRSYKLFNKLDRNLRAYENYRLNNTDGIRKDFYFKADTLASKINIMDNYNPQCNHQVVKIEVLENIEPAYDINVLADCHTFALPCGIFVHNCTDDNAGFSGGQSLSIISSRYAKMIKRIQNTMVQMLTDAINLIMIDTGNESYINKFTLRMQAPTTQEEVDRRDNMSNRISLVRDIMDTLSDIDNTTTKLKILKSLLSSAINDPSVIELLQEEIEQLEQESIHEEDSDKNLDNEEAEFIEPVEHSFSGDSPIDFNDTPNNDVIDMTDESDTNLPSPADLDIGDVSDATNPNLD